MICGFPGETQELHEELMQFVNDMEFDRLGAFTYSPEEGTPAAEMPDQVPQEQKEDWQADVMELQEEVIFDKNEAMKGTDFMRLSKDRLRMKQCLCWKNLPGCAGCRRIYFYQYRRRTYDRRYCESRSYRRI